MEQSNPEDAFVLDVKCGNFPLKVAVSNVLAEGKIVDENVFEFYDKMKNDTKYFEVLEHKSLDC